MLACLLLGVALTSCAATLPVQFTMPTQGNTGTCAAPTLVAIAPVSPQAVIRWRAVGATTERETTLAASLGSIVSVALPVAAGDYWVKAWAVNEGKPGCPDSVQKAATVLAPWKVGVLK
jgi:hypothetical protein